MICQASPAPDAFSRAELNAAFADERRVRGAQGRLNTAAAGKNSFDGMSNFIGKQAMGYVVTLKDDFGFVKPVNEDLGQMFFHVSDVIEPKPEDPLMKPDLRKMFKLQDEVQFVVEAARHGEGKYHAMHVHKLPSGTLDPVLVDPKRRRGQVRCYHGGDMYIEPYPEDGIVEGHQAPLQKIKFNKRKSMLISSKEPVLGDVVEFNVVTHKLEGICRAKNIEVIASAVSEESLEGRSLGHIIQLTEKGGEIRVLGIEGTAAFREADVSGSNGFEKLTVNCEVSFLLDASGAAVDLKLLPPGTISAKEILGTLRGKIRKLPTDNGPEGPQDGIIEYEKDGSMQEVRFGAQDVNEYLSTLAVNDQVNFELVRSRYTAKASAHGVTLSLRSDSTPELGCVSMLKKNFGFIKCCERIVDVFFHINALKPGSEALELNADVRFVPVMDSDTNKVVASELEVVPSGTAVFETVSTRRYTGAVKIPSSAAAEAAGDARGMGTGVIVAVIDGRIETIPYEHADVSNKEAFGVDDQVSFNILEDRRQVSLSHKAERKGGVRVRKGGRRAVKIALVSAASPPPVNRTPTPVRISPARALHRIPSFSAPSSPVRERNVPRNPAAVEAHFDRAETTVVPVSAAAAAALAASVKPGGRMRGTVTRLIRSAKRLPAGTVLGIARKAETDTWGKKKAAGNSEEDAVRRVLTDHLHSKGINVDLFEGDVLFWLTDVAPSARDSLKKRDEIEYTVITRPFEENSDVFADMAVDILRTRSHRPPNVPTGAPPKWSAGSGAASKGGISPLLPAGERRAPKFSGVTSVVVPGPEKGAIGFAAGRGKPLSAANSGPPSSAGSLVGSVPTTISFSGAFASAETSPKLTPIAVSRGANGSGKAPISMAAADPVPSLPVSTSAFQFKDAIAAQAFIPKSHSSESMKGVTSLKTAAGGSGATAASTPRTPRTPRSPLASIVNSANSNYVDPRFEDAEAR